MATVNFQIVGKTDKANIYLYVSVKRGQVFKKNTGYTINKADWSKANNRPKQTIAELKKLKTSLDILETTIYTNLNTAIDKNEIITADWLQTQLNKIQNRETKTEINTNLFLNYFQIYIDRLPNKVNNKGYKGVSERTISKLKAVKKLMTEFETTRKKKILIKDIEHNFQNELIEYLSLKKYSANYIGSIIKTIKTVCLDAKINEIETSPNLDRVKSFKETIDIITLSFKELNTINKTALKTDYLDNARDWFIIGCYIGQRVSDLLKLTAENIVTIGQQEFIELTQIKTKKKIVIPIHPIVKDILNKRNGEFPRNISDQKFNKYIKEVAKISGITEVIKGNLINAETNRKEKGQFEKWQLITSHTCRRSFATNYYGDIPTPLLISITGHSTETQFLEYIGKTSTEQAIQLAEYWTKGILQAQKKPIMNVIKKAN